MKVPRPQGEQPPPFPTCSNPSTWRGVIQGANFAIILPVQLAGSRLRSRRRTPSIVPPAKSPACKPPCAPIPFQKFSRWSQVPFWRGTPAGDDLRLDLIDLRFGTPDSPGFAGVSAVVDRQGNVLRSGFGILAPRSRPRWRRRSWRSSSSIRIHL